jgi:hypothetical protein
MEKGAKESGAASCQKTLVVSISLLLDSKQTDQAFIDFN